VSGAIISHEAKWDSHFWLGARSLFDGKALLSVETVKAAARPPHSITGRTFK
jgi:hypothetical protein